MIEFNFSPFPVLETERLILRQIKMEDAADYFALRTDPRVTIYTNRETPQSIEDVHKLIKTIDEWIATNEKIAWAIVEKGEGKGAGEKGDGKFIGTLSFHKTDRKHHRAEIGYQLVFEYWKKGYMNEAVKAAVAYAFNGMNLHSIEARVNELNAASIRVLEKNNFVKEAHFTEDFFHDGEYFDTGVYSLVNKK